MRERFFDTLSRIAAKDPRVIVLTADLGYTVLETFRERFPDRLFNVGVAEQNMVGLATGLAQSGFVPYIYSIAPFAVLRPLEFIRNGPVVHELPVRIVGVGAGFDYGNAGVSHHGLEDVAVLRALPNLSIVVPADDDQVETALLATHDEKQAIYYRLSRNGDTRIPGLKGGYRHKRIEVVREGRDIVFIAMGNISVQVAHAVEELSTQGISAGMAVVACVSPPPEDDLMRLLQTTTEVVTVEAHTSRGGLADVVGRVIAVNNLGCRLTPRSIDKYVTDVGDESYLLEKSGLDAASLVHASKGLFNKGRIQ